MATTYANGSVPESALAPLDGQPDAFLRADAAAAWNRARAEVKRLTGITLRVRGWNRTRAEQIVFYLQRHRLARKGERVCCYWQGRPYVFTGTAHAAPPGTSNHGWGLAIDVDDYGTVGDFDYPRRAETFPILAEHGWTDTEGRGSIREPWHLVYDPTRDTHLVSRPVPGAGGSITTPTIPGRPAPLTPTESELDMPYIVRCRVAGHKDNGTWWIVLPRHGQKPLATPLGRNDQTEGLAAINYATSAGYNTWKGTVATA
ncbi:hypothetical protein H9623_13345 [Oerskovia sp. Sa1BUA8]|uniref:Peptidase M15B domain-containing protein n=1 Tax=Oerskovia douganii TaxID=2762210 RepID=A0A9D5UAF2_9CELL|nr:M15 family metallopeptidase [Oerskovia douganii]MBE7701280.1 hypothetical protein [Oerskovia douganii]